MFRFKQFTVQQDRCAMKVGTDGVLLGAWAPVDHRPETILDIGTGSGLIALMLAQRTDAEQIDALEIDPDAYEQATENFEESPWGDRLFCFHAGLDEFLDDPEQQYDLIVSNPPFHTEHISPSDAARKLARFADSLPLEELVAAASVLLSPTGFFAVILPFKMESHFISGMQEAGFHLAKLTRVKGTSETPVKRSLMAFSRQQTTPDVSELILEEERHEYTPEFSALVRDFYLKL